MRELTYAAADGTDLRLDVFVPDELPEGGTGAVVFFFGGGWTMGEPEQFHPQCRFLSAHGLVGISADYRVRARHGTNVADAVDDARRALRAVRDRAGELGIRPDRIAAAGGSAGGHLALCTAFDEEPVPSALVLLNPAIDVSIVLNPDLVPPEQREALSPLEQARAGMPPAIIFHGTSDTIVPFSQVEAFAKRMAQYGNRCDLVPFEGEPHAFFNYGRGDNRPFQETMQRSLAFLRELDH